ncbi:hypothetical protein ACCI51_18030 [Microbulbifer echini]|uniref:Uncharacterized protein n=1 Tax=Microbulbifer echini TaxID=1529067 RepID=A0ABV4NSM9_9GAMM|nr:hypothetical protein [uncultured Microbulbifer sp.]
MLGSPQLYHARQIAPNSKPQVRQVMEHQKNDGLPPNVAKEKYWNTQGSVVKKS